MINRMGVAAASKMDLPEPRVEEGLSTKIMVVGVCMQQDHIRPLIAINKELNVHFLLGWSMEEFKESLQFISEGKFDVTPLITSRVSLDEVPAAFESLATPNEEAKVLVKPWN